MKIPAESVGRSSSGRGRLAARLALLVAVGTALLVGGRAFGAHLTTFVTRVDSLGVWGPVVFILGYALAAVAFIPGSVLTIAAGAIFGLGAGTLYALAGAWLGSSAAFLVARYLARGLVEQRIARSPRFAAVSDAVAANGRKIVFLLRLSPVVPFNVLNYALGVTRVRFVDYLIASVGMIPGTVLYVYYGTVAGALATAASAGGTHVAKGRGYYVLLVVGLLATVAATAMITRVATRALREQGGVGRE
jgi:uncharacterized membrane protein YdjX (TVP38/TMEM64 family)